MIIYIGILRTLILNFKDFLKNNHMIKKHMDFGVVFKED